MLILATIPDDRCNPGHIRAMVDAGMQGVRFNSAHASPQAIAAMTAAVRAVDSRQIILVDTKGAEVRTTPLAADADSLPVMEGARVTIIDGGTEPTTLRRLCITASDVCSHARVGMTVAVDDGEILMRVEAVESSGVVCRVTKGGRLGSRKTVNFRGIELDALPALTQRDRDAIDAAVDAGADIIAHSFVRSAADVEAVREALGNRRCFIYAKIECPQAVENMEEILAAADGLLCARGDLGATVGIERVPAVEMACIEATRRARKPLMIATELMQSMMTRQVPSRAEAMDIAFAAVSGVESLLLTAETARGEYPVECVGWMRRIIDATSDYIKR